MKPWQDSRAVKILVGATTILVILWWLVTGDLPFLSKLLFSKPEEGSTKSLDIWSVFGPMLVQACVIAGSAVIGLVSGAWHLLLGKLSPSRAEDSERSVQPAASSATSIVNTDIQEAAYGLCKAAEDNDPVAMESNRVLIRLPKVIRLHREAIERGDLEAAEPLYDELKSLLRPDGDASEPKSTSRKAGK